MTNDIKLPDGYVPFNQLELCSNTLVNVKIPFSVGRTPLLLIGKGKNPLVWLSAPARPKSDEWRYVVESNRSLNPAIFVEVNDQENTVVVRIKNLTIIKVVTKGEDSAVSDTLDFRPIGINIYGDKNGLTVGASKFAHNSVRNAQTAFASG
jgi:hypothetical protein